MRRCRTPLLLALVVFFALTAVVPLSAATVRRPIATGTVAALTEEQEIFIEATPRRGEGLIAFARRLTGSSSSAKEVTRLDGRRPRRLLAGVRYRVPYEALTQANKLAVMQALFPEDQAVPSGWKHVAPRGRSSSTLWRLALWFTGDGQNYVAIREHNELSDEELVPGQSLVIPRYLLAPAFAAVLPPPEVAHNLEYVKDDAGDHAVYRLKKGEALYSAVVVRFTGGTFAEDVNALAAELAELSGIPDVTDMPVGQRVKIPFDLLLPEFLPADHPRRVEYDKVRSEREKYSNPVRSARLEDITVILDAGHGGQDPGAQLSGTWESTYVYDIMLRIKNVLETTTGARVIPTTRDGARFSDHRPGRAAAIAPAFRLDQPALCHRRRPSRRQPALVLCQQPPRRGGAPLRRCRQDGLHLDPRRFVAGLPSRRDGLHPSGQLDPWAVRQDRLGLRIAQGVQGEAPGGVLVEGADPLGRPFRASSRGTLLASFRQQGLAIHREKPNPGPHHPLSAVSSLGAGGGALQCGASQAATRGVQSQQRRGSASVAHPGLSSARGGGGGRGNSGLLRSGIHRPEAGRCRAVTRLHVS